MSSSLIHTDGEVVNNPLIQTHLTFQYRYQAGIDRFFYFDPPLSPPWKRVFKNGKSITEKDYRSAAAEHFRKLPISFGILRILSKSSHARCNFVMFGA